MKFARVSALFSLTVLITFASAATAQAKEGQWECKHGKGVRKVEIKYLAAGKKVPCQVIYTKENETEGKTIFNAGTKEGFCENKAAEFNDKLAKIGYVCE